MELFDYFARGVLAMICFFLSMGAIFIAVTTEPGQILVSVGGAILVAVLVQRKVGKL